MPRNGAGVFALPAGSIATTGTNVLASQHNIPTNDIAADLNIARPIVAGGTGSTTAAAARTALGVRGPPRAVDTTGSGNAYLLTTADSLTPTDGDVVAIVANHANTGAATINVDGTGAVNIKNVVVGTVTALVTGDIFANAHYLLAYDSSAGAWIIYNKEFNGAIVGTSNYVADSVNLAAMVHGTAGGIITYGASGAPEELAIGSEAALVGVVGGALGYISVSNITRGTAINANTGTAHPFTLPVEINYLKFMIYNVSLDSTGEHLIQLSTSSSYVVTGYDSTVTDGSSSTADATGFNLIRNGAAANSYTGKLELSRVATGGHKWQADWSMKRDGATTQFNGRGDIELAGELDGIRITAIGGDNFDGVGVVNIEYY